MTLREFYLKRHDAEIPTFLRVLKSLPNDLGYKPHERSPSAEQLVVTIAGEYEACAEMASKNRSEWKAAPAPPLEQLIEKIERSANELKEQVSKMDEAAWNRPAQFYYEGQLVMERPLGEMLWDFLFDAIHHRGQLAAYLRPMGGKVPSIYGPSADDPGQ
jgi:uncharacterized damage-inducible protein DinB